MENYLWIAEGSDPGYLEEFYEAFFPVCCNVQSLFMVEVVREMEIGVFVE